MKNKSGVGGEENDHNPKRASFLNEAKDFPSAVIAERPGPWKLSLVGDQGGRKPSGTKAIGETFVAE